MDVQNIKLGDIATAIIKGKVISANLQATCHGGKTLITIDTGSTYSIIPSEMIISVKGEVNVTTADKVE